MPLKKKKVRRKRLQKKTIKRKVMRKKKLAVRKVTKKTAAKKPAAEKKAAGKIIGVVTHYFPKVRAGVVKLKASLSVGDTIKIKGHTTDFTQNITSMQIDRVAIDKAKKGQEIGLLVDSRVRKHDTVYKG